MVIHLYLNFCPLVLFHSFVEVFFAGQQEKNTQRGEVLKKSGVALKKIGNLPQMCYEWQIAKQLNLSILSL